MTARWLAVAVIVFITPLCSAAQDSSDARPLSRILWSDVTTGADDGIAVYSAPAHFTPAAWITTAGVVAGTVLLFSVDGDARSFALRNQSTVNDRLAKIGTVYGNAAYALSASGGCYVVGLVARNRDIRETGMTVFESITFAGIATSILKSVIGRSRPFREEGPRTFHPGRFAFEETSLPSGHSTVAFAASSALAARFGSPVLTVGVYTLAFITAASRVYNDEHWLSDTFLGAAIGTATGLEVASLHREREGKGEAALHLYPSLRGITFAITF